MTEVDSLLPGKVFIVPRIARFPEVPIALLSTHQLDGYGHSGIQLLYSTHAGIECLKPIAEKTSRRDE